MFARLSNLDKNRIAYLNQSRGWKINPSTKTVGFAQETALYEKAVAAANRLNPAFVVIFGDMLEDPNAPDQLAELRRITGMLHRHIPVHWVPGNWDVGTTPNSHTLEGYRERFGADYYSFTQSFSCIILCTVMTLVKKTVGRSFHGINARCCSTYSRPTESQQFFPVIGISATTWFIKTSRWSPPGP